jgi:hypothetical protein
METEIIQLISQFGFPIAMCLWFMFRVEKLIKANTEATTNLAELIKKGLKIK